MTMNQSYTEQAIEQQTTTGHIDHSVAAVGNNITQHVTIGVPPAQSDIDQTHTDYLNWLIERNEYLDPSGTIQTQRQVQLKLDAIYIGLRARLEEERRNDVDRKLLDSELANLEAQLATSNLATEEKEDQREMLLARFERHRSRRAETDTVVSHSPIPLSEAVAKHERLVNVGVPGNGKTTLLRYLAYQLDFG